MYLWYLLDAFIFTVLAVYLDKVLPNENGVREVEYQLLPLSVLLLQYQTASGFLY